MEVYIGWPAENELERREATAYHEAGHCVMAWVYGVKVYSVTATTDKKATGISADGFIHGKFLNWDCGDDRLPSWKRAREEILIALAGPLASARHGGFTRFSSWLSGGRSDYRRAQEIALRYFPQERARHLLDVELRREARRILNQHWSMVRIVAGRLIQGGTVAGDELEKLMDRAAVEQGLSRSI